jgi:hypothetical protein
MYQIKLAAHQSSRKEIVKPQYSKQKYETQLEAEAVANKYKTIFPHLIVEVVEAV